METSCRYEFIHRRGISNVPNISVRKTEKRLRKNVGRQNIGQSETYAQWENIVANVFGSNNKNFCKFAKCSDEEYEM